jgi:formylglycine-generating enzyme required for sulfatase activity
MTKTAVTLALSACLLMAVAPAQSPETMEVTLPKSLTKVKFVRVPGGSVQIGGNATEVKPFWIATTETTWDAFDVFLASGPPSRPYDQTEFAPDAVARPSKSYILPDLGWGHRGFPAINLSFTSADMFCRWLSAAREKRFRVPTEAEWELACRAGLPDPLTQEVLDAQSWNASNSMGMTNPVAKKEPNGLGLFDMLGNVGEWATDASGKPILCGPHFRDEPATVSPTLRRYWEPKWQETDPQMPKSRWWLSDAPFAGFRLVCEG